jgi:hypothetical protein
MRIPDCVVPILTIFRPGFSTPTYHRFLVLLLGALLTAGRRTITNALRTVRHQALGQASSYDRVLSQRHWSTWTLARTLITSLLTRVIPMGPVFLAGDDTVAEHPGPGRLAKAGIVMGSAPPTAIRRIGGGISGLSSLYWWSSCFRHPALGFSHPHGPVSCTRVGPGAWDSH